MLFDAYLSKDGLDKESSRDDKKSSPELDESLHMLQALCNFLRRAVAFVVVALLWMASRSYLSAVFNGRVPGIAKVFERVYMGAIVIAIAVFIFAAFTARNFDARFASFRSSSYIKALRFAIGSSIVYSVVSVGLAGFAASLPIVVWSPPHLLARVMITVAFIWVLAVSPIPLVLLLVRTVPAFATPRSSESRPQSSAVAAAGPSRTPSRVTGARLILYWARGNASAKQVIAEGGGNEQGGPEPIAGS
jgi:hypothetical protein